MKVLNYKQAAWRIAQERKLELSASRDRVLSAVANRLLSIPPNTGSNMRRPWKLKEHFSVRAWCPLHDGRFERLIVRVDENCHVTYECFQGCTSDEVAAVLYPLTKTPPAKDAVAPQAASTNLIIFPHRTGTTDFGKTA
jgi:hypothetical protein